MDRTSILFCVLAAALAAGLYMEIERGLLAPEPIPPVEAASAQRPTVSGPASGDQTGGGEPDLKPPDAEEAKGAPRAARAYGEIVERSLFSPTRRPATVSKSRGAPAARAERLRRLRLVGSVQIETRRFAIIEDPTAATYMRLAIGDEIYGWRLSAIADGSAVFARGGPGAADERLELKR